MGKKAKRIIALFMSVIIMCSTLLANNIVARAEGTNSFRIRLTPIAGCSTISYKIGDESSKNIGINNFNQNEADQSNTVWHTWEYANSIDASTIVTVTLTPSEGYSVEGATPNQDGSYTFTTTIVENDVKEIEIRLAQNNNQGTQTNPGDVQFRINNSQSGKVYIAKNIDSNAEWIEVTDNTTKTKNDLSEWSTIYVKYVLNAGQSLDDYVDNSGISCNAYRVNGDATNLTFNDSIAQITYDNSKSYEISISFKGNNNQGPQLNSGDVQFHIVDKQNGNVFVSPSGVDGTWLQVSDNEVINSSKFTDCSKIYVKYEDQDLDDYKDAETNLSFNVYRVDGVDKNLEFNKNKIAEVPYDANKTLEISLRFKSNDNPGSGSGSGASKDYPFETKTRSNITFTGTNMWDGAGLPVTATYYINGVAAFSRMYDSNAKKDIVTHLDSVKYPYDADATNPTVDFEFANPINMHYTSIKINGVDYSAKIPGSDPAKRTWDILNAMNLNRNSQDISFIIEVPIADTYTIEANMEIIGETRYSYDSNDSKVTFTIENNLNGTVGYKYDTINCSDVSASDATFPTTLESDKPFTLYAKPMEGFEFRSIHLKYNNQDVSWDEIGNPNSSNITTESGMTFTIPDSMSDGNKLEIFIEFSEDTAWKENQMTYFPTGNFLWSNLEEDSARDMFLDHTQVKFVRFEYLNENGDKVVIDNINDMNREAYLNFSEDYDKGEATLLAGGELTVQLVPKYGFQVVQFGPNGGAFWPNENSIATYTFTIANGNAHLGAKCAAVEDAVKTEATGVSSGGIALDVTNDTNFEMGTAVLEVTDVATTDEEKTQFENEAEGYQVESYLDLSLNNVVYKGSAENVWETKVKDLSNPATISLTVDEEITEDVVIIHQKHDGTYETIAASYDEASKTISFETDSFSKYAIAQKKDHVCSFTEEVISEETLVSAPTCTSEGVYKKSCSCGAIGEETFTTSKLEHKMTCVEGKEANCKETGSYTYYTCEYEADVYYKDAKGTEKFENKDATIIPKNDNHVFDEKTFVSDEKGHHYQVCSVCEEHSQSYDCKGGVATCNTKAVCDVCKTQYGEYNADNHVISDKKKDEACGCGKIKNLEATGYDQKLHVKDMDYTGDEVKPVITIDGLTQDVDFKVSDVAKVLPGVYTVTVTGMGSYVGTRTVEWKIVSSDGWQKVDDKWIFVEDGSTKTGWVEDSGTWYFMDETGIMQTGWTKDGDTWYFMNESGAMQTGWEKINDTWYYMDNSGAMQTGWEQVNNTWYYMDESGAMVTGWEKVDDTWYFMDNSGAMVSGWLLDGSTWYYLDNSGAMKTGWLLYGSTWYYLDKSGNMVTGWLKDGENWYYLDNSGAMQTGWVFVGSTWYYFDNSGVMQTGWILDGTTWYYLYENGAMASNTYIGSYYLNASGAWVR